MLANGLPHIFRSLGLIKESTVGIVLGNAVNIVLDWFFIVILHMGTAGAALATSIGFLCSSIYYICCLIQKEKTGNPSIALSPHQFKPEKQMVLDVVKIGIPGALITVMPSVSNIILNNYISLYGSNAVASYGIAYKIDLFPIMLSVGLSTGIAPLIGFCYGAGQKERLEKSMDTGTACGVVLGILFTSVFMLFAEPLASIFLHEKAPGTADSTFPASVMFSCSAAGHYQYDYFVFSGTGQSSKFSDHYRAPECGSVYSRPDSAELSLATERRDSDPACDRGYPDSNMPDYVCCLITGKKL